MPNAVQRPQYTGFALPAVRINGGYFASRSTYDVAWGDLLLAAFCPQGGRLMRRSFGSSVSSMVMEPLDSFLKAEIASRLRDAVERQCPHVRLIAVDVKEGKAATGVQRTLDVIVSFTVTNDRTQVETRAARLDRASIIQVVSAFQASRGG